MRGASGVLAEGAAVLARTRAREKYDENATLRAVVRIEAALRPHARLYDFADDLFRRRAAAASAATGVRLICETGNYE